MWSCLTASHYNLEVLLVHANAVLTSRARLRLAELVVEQGWSLRRAAERFQCSVPTVQRWRDRYCRVAAAGREVTVADMADRSSRPRHCLRATPRPLVRKIKHLRQKKRLGPAMIAGWLGTHPQRCIGYSSGKGWPD